MRERADNERRGHKTHAEYLESVGMPEHMRRDILSGVKSGATKQKTPNLNKARAQFTEAIARDALGKHGSKQRTPNLNKARAQFTQAIACDALTPRAS